MMIKASDWTFRGIVAVGTAAFVLGFVAPAMSQTASPRVATILHVEGKARYSVDNVTWQPLKAGVALNLGGVIQTADKSRVDVLFDDPAAESKGADTSGGSQIANVVRLLPGTVLAIDRLTATRYDAIEEVQLDLRSGQILGSARKLMGTAKYEVKVANGVVGIRGGHFKIYSNGVVDSFTGSLVAAETVSDGTLATKLVPAGKRFDPVANLVTDAPPLDKKESNPIKESSSSSNQPQRMVPDITGGFRKY